MQRVYYIVIIAFMFIFLFVFCASTDKTSKKEVSTAKTEEQTEQDILKLLEVEEGKGEKVTTLEQVGLDDKITELERQLIERNSEINELKSELVLKDERLDELQSKADQMEKGFPQMKKIDFNEFAKQYQIALNTYYSRKYKEAISIFDELLAIDMNNSLSDNCQYWKGECFYALRDFKRAIVEFEKVFTFVNNNKDDDAQLKLGLCYLNLNDKERASSEFNRLLKNYPKSEYVEKTKKLLEGF